jgi:tetratricopeptide (TPR) repeat protein
MSAARAADAGVPAASPAPTEVVRLRAEAQRHPQDAALRRRLAEHLITLGALGEAEGHLAWLRERPDQKAAATLLLCRARRIVNRWSEGMKVCKEAAALLPRDPDAQRELGLLQLAAREHSVGLASLQRAVDLAPGRADLHRTLGWALLSLHRAKPALVPLTEAVRLAPGDPYARTLLGDAFWGTAQHRKAEAAYRQAAAMTTGAPVHRAEALDKLGTLWASLGKRSQAEAVLKACQELYPYLGCPYTKVALLPANPDRIPGSEPVRPYRDVAPDK